MEHHSHTARDIPGLPADAVRLEGPPKPNHDGWVYTYQSDSRPGVWSVVFPEDGSNPWVIYQPSFF